MNFQMEDGDFEDEASSQGEKVTDLFSLVDSLIIINYNDKTLLSLKVTKI